MPIRWARQGDQPLESVDHDAKPVLISAGSLGPDRPRHDLIVSPQHRILVGDGTQLQDYFRTAAFAPAKSLTSLRGIRHMNGKRKITCHHFACDAHQVVDANGCKSESLLLGSTVIKGLTKAERMDLSKIFGPAPTPETPLNGPAARPCLKVGAVRRHLKKCLKAHSQRTADEIAKWDRDLTLDEGEDVGFAQKSRKSQIRNF